MTKARIWFVSIVVGLAGGFTGASSTALCTTTQSRAQSSKAGQTSARYQKLLTVADVESATGVKGVKLVPRGSATGAGGDLNFAKADGSLLLMAEFGPASLYKQWKEQKGFVNEAVSGLGDEAFNGPEVKTPYALFFRKGEHSVSLSSFLNIEDMKPLISQEQLRALAKIVLSRL